MLWKNVSLMPIGVRELYLSKKFALIMTGNTFSKKQTNN